MERRGRSSQTHFLLLGALVWLGVCTGTGSEVGEETRARVATYLVPRLASLPHLWAVIEASFGDFTPFNAAVRRIFAKQLKEDRAPLAPQGVDRGRRVALDSLTTT